MFFYNTPGVVFHILADGKIAAYCLALFALILLCADVGPAAPVPQIEDPDDAPGSQVAPAVP
jgi:hypothetical protein